jgi:hypothetical protein
MTFFAISVTTIPSVLTFSAEALRSLPHHRFTPRGTDAAGFVAERASNSISFPTYDAHSVPIPSWDYRSH